MPLMQCAENESEKIYSEKARRSLSYLTGFSTIKVNNVQTEFELTTFLFEVDCSVHELQGRAPNYTLAKLPKFHLLTFGQNVLK